MTKILDENGRILLDHGGYHENGTPYGAIKLNAKNLEDIVNNFSYLKSMSKRRTYFTSWIEDLTYPYSQLKVLYTNNLNSSDLATMRPSECPREYIITSSRRVELNEFLSSILPFCQELIDMFPCNSSVQLPGEDNYQNLVKKLETHKATTGDDPFEDRPWI